ncbi:tannase/feruloyl esterase family alpha/beta hydrolase [Parahaliea maris]|uniref:tannase/feruloyl esterase family alpha/beta hydrolase n=1 Tax=Parahaliea maris TaxID=2716870 RepID=UPI00164F3E85|nr:tannase/feruloyl esterase family alpha/beta hydrolase [Parahaliea maris]
MKAIIFYAVSLLLPLAGSAFAAPLSANASLCSDKFSVDQFAERYGVETLTAVYQADETYSGRGGAPAALALVPHCKIDGALDAFTAPTGEQFRIRFRLRLPDAWNGRFLFMGGGGSNGRVGASVGDVGWSGDVALNRGFAVVSQDSGHSNEQNNSSALGGIYSFGTHPETRRNYAYGSLIKTYDLAQALMAGYYQRPVDYNYFFGCSKGGQEGLAFAELYPDSFDGIVAAAPGMSLPKAALNQAWDTQVLAGLAVSQGRDLSPAAIARSLPDSALAVVTEAVLVACDADDGAEDGLLSAYGKCSTARVLSALESRRCESAGGSHCISSEQITALVAIVEGSSRYTSFPWDAGFADAGWRRWKLGSEDSPARNISLGAASLAAVFSVPPTILPEGADAKLNWQVDFDFSRDARAIFAADKTFVRSAWAEMNVRFADLSAFSAAGKLIVPHGVSDPVFSVNDTVAWWNELDYRYDGKANTFVRVFPVPGMGHCRGGPGPHRLNAFDQLSAWVERDQPPEYLLGETDAGSRWAGKKIPVCSYPSYARPASAGDGEYACSGSYDREK